MAGYLDNKNRVLNEWYQLFIKNSQINSKKHHEFWENIKYNKLLNTNNDNNWKYISTEEFFKNHFIDSQNNVKLNISDIEKLSYPIESDRLIFINGKFSPHLSDKNTKPWILTIHRDPNLHEIVDPIQSEIFVHILESLSKEIIHINLPAGNKINKPLYLLYINTGSNIPNTLTTSHYFHYLTTEHDTDAYVIEHFVSMNTHGHFSGSRMLISVGNRSTLNHIKLIFENRNSYHISHHDIHSGKSTNINSKIFLILGPKLTFHKTNVQLNYSNTSIALNSLILLSGQDIGNIHTYLEHNNKSYALSRQIHKIIACDYSTGTFNGLIKVNQNSIETDGTMINNNLLLHQTATINTIPKLEIYSDHVKCSHGATIGQININHLFYLKTRGISHKDAFNMLIHAFANEITENIKNIPLQNIILARINQALIRSII